jgi:lysophospholipase L1-like esterase
MKQQFTKMHALACVTSGLMIALIGCDTQKQKPSKPLDQAQQAGPDFWNPVMECSSTTAPEKIHDDYWRGQFERVNREVEQAEDTQLVFFGDSITMDWTLLRGHGKEVWQERFAKYKPINMGNSGDITPVMLYRATHGNLDFPEGQEPRVAVLLCGTNNYVVMQSAGGEVKWKLGPDTPPDEVADGVRAVAQAFRRQLPTTRVIVLGILPVKQQEKWDKCEETNRILSTYDYPQDKVVFLDLEDRFMNPDGTLKSGLYTDGTHLTPEGYAVMADALAPEIGRLIELGPIGKKDS